MSLQPDMSETSEHSKTTETTDSSNQNIVSKDDHYEGELVSSWGWHAPSPVAQQMGGGLILSNEVA